MIRHLVPLLLVLPLFAPACTSAPKPLTSSPSADDYARFNATAESQVDAVPQTRPADASPVATLGHWQHTPAPNARQTQVWVPTNSYVSPPADQPSQPDPSDQDQDYSGDADPVFVQVVNADAAYASDLGRYDTIRYPDGRLEFQWKPDEPSTPQQGFWQVLTNQQRVWMPGAQGAAGDH